MSLATFATCFISAAFVVATARPIHVTEGRALLFTGGALFSLASYVVSGLSTSDDRANKIPLTWPQLPGASRVILGLGAATMAVVAVRFGRVAFAGSVSMAGHGCRYQVNNHGSIRCVSRAYFKLASAGQGAFIVAITGVLTCVVTAAQYARLRWRPR